MSPWARCPACDSGLATKSSIKHYQCTGGGLIQTCDFCEHAYGDTCGRIDVSDHPPPLPPNSQLTCPAYVRYVDVGERKVARIQTWCGDRLNSVVMLDEQGGELFRGGDKGGSEQPEIVLKPNEYLVSVRYWTKAGPMGSTIEFNTTGNHYLRHGNHKKSIMDKGSHWGSQWAFEVPSRSTDHIVGLNLEFREDSEGMPSHDHVMGVRVSSVKP